MWRNIGAFYYKKSNYDRSIDCWRRVIDIWPSKGDYFQLALAEYNRSNDSEALLKFNNAIEIDSTDYQLFYWREDVI